MPHYFTKDNDTLASAKKPIWFVIRGREFKMTTDHGVFSKAGLDFGTRTLLENVEVGPDADILDLGCGFGAVGVVLGALFGARVTMTDINDRAVELARDNAFDNGVDAVILSGDGCLHVPGLFDCILTNPPIRAGKAVVYRLFREAREKLKENGSFVLVINKNQGAESAIQELATIYGSVELLAKKSGYHVLSCRK
ncbi:MAG: methyltransferase [Bacillota bacterium]|nr:methyltransferase [Bacillota bacterium]